MDRDGHRRGGHLSADRSTPRTTTVSRGVGAALLAGTLVAQMLRTRGIPVWDTVWLEDSDVYLTDVSVDGPFAVVLRGYAGYLQLLPRLLAIPAAVLPITVVPLYFALAGSAVGTAAAAFVNRSLGGWVATAPVRLAVAATAVVGPALAIENTALVTNTIWAAFLVVPFALVSTRSTRWDVVARAAVCAVAAMSTALCALFAPVALGVWVVRRTRDSLVVGAALGAGLAAQLLVVRSTDIADSAGSSARVVADMFGVRVLGALLVGEIPLDRLWTDGGEPVALVFAAVTVALLAVAARGSAARERRAAALFVVLAVVCFVVPVWLRGSNASGFSLDAYTQSWTRYTCAPIVFLLTALALLVDPPGPSGDRRVAVTGRKVLVAQVAVVVAMGLSTTTVRSAGPRWSDEVRTTYLAECAGAPPDLLVEVTASPPNFAATLPCERLGP